MDSFSKSKVLLGNDVFLTLVLDKLFMESNKALEGNTDIPKGKNFYIELSNGVCAAYNSFDLLFNI